MKYSHLSCHAFKLVALLVLGAALPVSAQVITLTFEGLGDQQTVGNYYDGGAGGNYGITFSSNSLSIVSYTYGGTGNFLDAPSMPTILFFLQGGAATMDIANGFDTGFSFYYASSSGNAFFEVYDGFGGTGTLLATGQLSDTFWSQGGFNLALNQVGVSFSGVAHSVLFGGAANYVGFDNITFGSAVATPGGGVPTSSDIDTAQASYLASNVGATVNPAFVGGTLLVDQAGTYTQDFTVDASGTNNLDQGGLTATFSGAFSDANGVAGNLIIANSGSGGAIIFTGLNTYTGGTTINAGATLQVGDGGTAGSIAGNVTDNGSFILNRSDNITFAGAVSGTGSFTQAGAGTLIVTGTNTYTGGTTINAGATLQLGAGSTTGSIAGNVTDNGSLIFNRSNAVTFAGVVSGTGSLGQTGANTVTLTGTNTYTGGTTITQGTVSIGTDANLGAATGALTLNGGTLALSNSVTTTRPIVVGSSSGTLDTGASQLATGGALSGTGSLLKAGAGSWNLTGTGTGYTGALQVAQGTLFANTTLGAATVTVAAPAVLRGTGTLLGSLSVLGRLSPGNSPGTLSVTGPVSFGAGSTAAFEIDGPGTGSGAGNYSRLVSGSTVSLNGAVLAPVLRGLSGSASNTFTPSMGQLFHLINAAGGLGGSFSSLTQADGLPSGLIFDTVYGANTVDLVVTPADYGQLGPLGVTATLNRTRTGAALQALRPAPGTRGANSAFLNVLYPLGAADLTSALDQIGTALYGQILEGSLQALRRAELASRQARHDAEPVWLDVSALEVRAPGDGLVRGFDLRGGGGMVGFDLWRRPTGLAGVALGHEQSQLVSAGPDHGRADTTTEQLVGYGRLDRGPWRLDLNASLGFARSTVKRTVAFGTFATDLQSEPKFELADSSLNLSREVHLGALPLRPGLLVQSGTAWMSGFTEQGAAPVALRHHTGTVSRLEGGATLETDQSFHLGGHALELGLRLAYLGEAYTSGAGNTVSLSADPATPFTLRAQRPSADFLQARALAALQLHGNSEAYLSLENSALSRRHEGYNLNTGVRLHW